MKKLRILLLTILVFVFAFQSMACNTNQGQPDAPHMNDRVYERIDEEALNSLLDKIYTLVEEDGHRYEIKKLREQFFADFYYKSVTMYWISSINYDKDVTSEYWAEESALALTIAENIQNTALELEKAVFASEYYGEYFTKIYGQDYADSILVVELETEEQLALSAEMATLEAQYNTLYAAGKTNDLYDLYAQLVKVRNQYAQTKTDTEGNPYKNYMDYAYKNRYGREYTPEEVASFRASIKANFVSLKDKFSAASTNFTAEATLTEKNVMAFLPYIIKNTAPEMLSSWQYMVNKGLYDFAYSTKKANTSYVTTFSEYDDAYMFVNTSKSVIKDLPTFIHEFGHYNEKFMADESLEDPSGVRSYDLAETHSQAFELITLPVVEKLIKNNYTTENLYETYAFNLIYDSVWAVLSNCAFDEFEYTIYNADPETVNAQFIRSTFGTVWRKYWGGSGIEFYQVPHFFSSPAYCISYAVSLIFSAEIWASDDPIGNYLTTVKYGSYNYLSTVYTALGLESPLSDTTVKTVAEAFTTYTDTNILN